MEAWRRRAGRVFGLSEGRAGPRRFFLTPAEFYATGAQY
jgi:hypothetical protein